jgi:ferric-dicitrate binding protein FerR (iron transport regulator)
MEKDAIRILLEEYREGSLTETRREELLALMQPENEEEWLTLLQELIETEAAGAIPVDPRILRASLQRVLSVDRSAEIAPVIPMQRSVFRRYRWAAAAAILLMLSGIFYLVVDRHPKDIADSDTPMNMSDHDLAPGGNKATLTLAGGQKIVLDSNANGTIARQGNATIEKLAGGQLAYQHNNNEKPSTILYNTLETPRGGQYQLKLPDGTGVWLDAASSIRYPVFFGGKERRVTVTGQAYFEVAHNAAKPFIVEAAGAEVRDIGTGFNINAYPEEGAERITLVEGSVRISRQDRQLVLRPDEQARVGEQGFELVEGADLEQILAWKNGKFMFGEKADIQTIMRQVARWYDVDVEYQGTVSLHFGGTISRRDSAAKLLEKLEMTNGVHFKIEGRKIIVLP